MKIILDKMNLFTLILCLIFSCDKDPVKMDIIKTCAQDTIKTNLQIIWQVPIVEEDTAESYIDEPIFYKNSIITLTESDNYGPAKLVARNKLTGEKLWMNNDFFVKYAKATLGYYVIENRIFFFSDGTNFCINLDNGQTIWSERIDYGDIRMGYFGDQIFFNTAYEIPGPDSLHIWQFDTKSFTKKKLFSLYKNGPFNPSVESWMGYLLPNGDTALFFQNRQWGFGGGGGRIDVHAYNITRNKFIWRNDDID
ncbi:MAG: hypothetical protein M3Q56_08400, partial [Bacteroidota bacterium]|nr:hypothetical protein [Bacteroidota bacterium]